MSNATAELVQNLIRNECVNDGTIDSGFETRNAEVIASALEQSSLDFQIFEELPGRASLVSTIKGSDPQSPKLLLQGHTDVVPADAGDWEFDPFGGEIIDGHVTGRGAVDMFNITASMAIAMVNISKSGFVPKGDVIFAAVADEEAGGNHGAGYLVENHYELVEADYVLSESGGTHMKSGGETFLPVVVGEKGVHWVKIEIDGTPSHGSKPYGADNSNLKAVDIVQRFTNFKPPVQFVQGWETFLTALGINKDLVQKLGKIENVDEALTHIHQPLDSVLHSCCHQTFSPNVIHGGVKVNTIADHTYIELDIRTLPGTTLDQLAKMINEVLGEYSDQVRISYSQNEESTISPTQTPLWNSLQAVSSSIFPGAQLLPTISTFGTDSRFWRRKGAVAYGAALFDPEDVNYEDHLSMFHGRNEKVSVKSLAHTTNLYEGVIRSLGDFT
ncbi:MAG TPA: M20/M25/M40 family metallo-hydrolase [Acidimicrobiia bacterium]|nr:M20/M25/M40 family metallo-hydrolase [Acidimicrobiia bacterium]